MAKRGPTDQIDEEIIAGCRKGNRKAQEVLYTTCAPRILGIIYRYVPDYDTANEILQLTAIKMFRHIDRFKEGSFINWVTRIAVNTALNEIKKNKKYREMQSISDANTDHYGQSFEDDSPDIINLLKTLNSDERAIFNLRAIEGYSFREISEMLEITEGNARVSYHRIRSKVKSKIEDLFLR